MEAIETGNRPPVVHSHSSKISLVRKWIPLYQEGGTLTPAEPNAALSVVSGRKIRRMAAEAGELR